MFAIDVASICISDHWLDQSFIKLILKSKFACTNFIAVTRGNVKRQFLDWKLLCASRCVWSGHISAHFKACVNCVIWNHNIQITGVPLVFRLLHSASSFLMTSYITWLSVKNCFCMFGYSFYIFQYEFNYVYSLHLFPWIVVWWCMHVRAGVRSRVCVLWIHVNVCVCTAIYTIQRQWRLAF